MSVSLNRVLQTVKDNGGFLRDIDVKMIAEQDRLRLLLVRDVAHFIQIISNEDSDYVRDVSLPTTDPIYRG